VRCSAVTSRCWTDAIASAACWSSARRSSSTPTLVAMTTGGADAADDAPDADGVVSCRAEGVGARAGDGNGACTSGAGEAPCKRGSSQPRQYPIWAEYKLMQPIWQPLGPQLHRFLRCELCCMFRSRVCAHSQSELCTSRRVASRSEGTSRKLSELAQWPHRPSCSP
jgi:hypothetical protein